jgi:16S rRNA (cytosine1402-N4)-methyltransferase
MSSMQMDTPDRGFSFQQEGPLDMRMDTTKGPSASEYLARANDEELVGILRTYGDIAPARRIARVVLEYARTGRMNTTADLILAVQEALNCLKRVPEEVRTVFQAIRIAINEELRWLETGVGQAIESLAPGGRLVVISFHSGEDRIVKNLMRDASKPKRTLEPDGRLRSVEAARFGLLTSKPVSPSTEETRANSRAHSARLRALERLN